MITSVINKEKNTTQETLFIVRDINLWVPNTGHPWVSVIWRASTVPAQTERHIIYYFWLETLTPEINTSLDKLRLIILYAAAMRVEPLF